MSSRKLLNKYGKCRKTNGKLRRAGIKYATKLYEVEE